MMRFMLIACMMSISCDNSENQPVKDRAAAWEKLGTISDGFSDCTLYKTIDNKNGATIYISVGANKNAMFVLPKVE